jgi:TonB family protein
MLEATPRTEAGAIRVGSAYPDRQRRRLLIAIVLLLSALVVVLVKDRDYWFGSPETAATEEPESVSAPIATPAQVPSTPATSAPAPAPVAKATKHAETKRTARPAVTRNVAPAAAPSQWGPATTAAERARIAPVTPEEGQPADSSYPLLSGQMAVQGSVLLQALIATDGVVEDLRVLSGPTILASAAREAVRQWRFKPFYQNGKAVETQARVTVNFTIKVSNNTARYQPSSITADGAL